MSGIARPRRQHRPEATAPSVSHSEPQRTVAAVPFAKETALAWALADAAKPHLNAVERCDVYIAIGVGDVFAAIHDLITTAAGRRIGIPGRLVQACHDWLDVHVGHEDERHLRGLVEAVLTPSASDPDKDERC